MDNPPSAVLIFIGLTSFLVLSCIDIASDSDAESGPAVIQGRVDEISTVNSVVDAIVRATWVSSTGDLETIGTAEAEVDENGAYMLSISEEAWEDVAIDRRIVLQVEKGEALAKTFITSETISGIIVQAKPITVESTAEANVLEKVVENNNEADIQNADIELAVTTRVGSALNSDPRNVTILAEALSVQNKVKAMFYERQGIDPNYGEIYRLKNEAQVELENRLYDLGESPEDRLSAVKLFLQEMARVEIEAGIDPFQTAVASALSQQVAWNESNSLSEQGQNGLYRVNSYTTAVTITRSVQNELEIADLGNGISSVADEAGQTIQRSLLDDTEASVEEIRTMFDAYREQVFTAIENIETENSETFVSVYDLIRRENGAQAAFESALKSASAPEDYTESYNQFSSEVRSEVNSSFNDLASDTSEAYANLMILLNIAS